MKRISNPTAPWPILKFLLLPFLLIFAECAILHGAGEESAQFKGHQVTLAWEPAATHVAGYYVYRESPPGSSPTKLTEKPITGPEYQDRAVVPGNTYAYYVTTVGDRGRESAPSNRVTATVPAQ